MIAALLLSTLLDPQAGAFGVTTPPPQGGRAAAQPAAPAASAELRVVVAAPVYRPDGGVTAETATLASNAPSLVYIYGRRSLCDTATTGAAEPADAGFGWRLTSNTVSQSATEMVVSVDWQRIWDRGGKRIGGPAGTVQLTLHPGDRIPLDLIQNTVASDSCRAVGMGLEVRVVRAAAAPPSSANVVLPLGSTEGGARVLDADLWLLHTLPSGTQQVQHQTVRLPTAGGTFGFTTVKFATPQGEIGVELTGSIQRYRTPSGEFLLVSMARVVTGGTTPASGLGGTTGGTLIPLPGPAEVLSFELSGSERRMLSGGGVAALGGVAAAGGPRGGGGGGSGGGGGGRGGAGGGTVRSAQRTPAPAEVSAVAGQVSRLLGGQAFSIRVQLTPVAGS